MQARKCAISACYSCPETKWLGLHNGAWKCGQVMSRLKLVECHQHRSICAALINPGNPRLPCAEPAWASLHRLRWRISVSIVFWGNRQSYYGRTGCRSPPRELINLLCSSISNVFSNEVPVFSFLLLKEHVSLLVLDIFLQRYSQPVIQKRKKWQNSLIKSRKGKEMERGRW